MLSIKVFLCFREPFFFFEFHFLRQFEVEADRHLCWKNKHKNIEGGVENVKTIFFLTGKYTKNSFYSQRMAILLYFEYELIHRTLSLDSVGE